MRKLIHVPIIHTLADLGSLATDINKKGLEALGQDAWKNHMETIDDFWCAVSRYFEFQNVKDMKIYQDGLVAGNEIAKKIIEEGVNSGSKNYELVSNLICRGASIVKTEDFDLVNKEREMLLEITGAKTFLKKSIAASKYKFIKKKILNKRDSFITKRINETLKSYETGIIFIGAYHNIIKRLPEDIIVVELKKVEKLREYQELIPFYNKKKKRIEKLREYLVKDIVQSNG